MLRGKYRINASNPEACKKLVAICRSLAAEGAEYETKILPNGWVWVEAHGGKAPKRKPCRPRVAIPAPVSSTRIQKQTAEAKRGALTGGMIPNRRRMGYWECDRQKQAEDKHIGRLIARAMARGEATIEARLIGRDIYGHGIRFRVDQLLNERKKHHQWKMQAAPDSHEVLQARLGALAEYKYWRELEALSGQRSRWKPGLTDETFYADDQA